MQIYLTPPGGEPEGPYTLEEINGNLARRKYKDTDYWAWYEGQKEWVPLHKVPGVVGSDETAAWMVDSPAQDRTLATIESQPTAKAGTEAPAAAIAAAATIESSVKPETVTPKHEAPGTPPVAASPPPQPEGAPTALERDLFSGLTFAALEQIFILTTGDGPTASRSEVTTRLLEQTVGQNLAAIRAKAQRDVLSHCAFIEQLRTQATLPMAAWNAMANFRNQLVRDARSGLFKVCVRTFPIENGDLVCLFLFYNRANL